MRTFLSDAGLLIERTDRMTYREFQNGMKTGLWKKAPFNPETYVAVFFDEAQELLSSSRNRPTTKAEPALKLWHPHKICLTASPIDSDPMEAYILSAVCNNKPLNGDSLEARENTKDMRKFRERFCETVGGRILGVKQDPNTKRDMSTWVRRNIFFADKQDVDVAAGETPLSKLREGTHAVTMDPSVEVVYRSVTKQFAAALGVMVKSFRDRDIGSGKMTDATKEMEAMMTAPKMAPVMKLMNDLSNYPDVALRDIANMIQNDQYINAKGQAVAIPPVLAKAFAAWKKSLNPDDLRTVADRVGNPKLASAGDIIAKRLERSSGSNRTILFSDDRKMCMKSVQYMADNIGGMHALALDNEIQIFNGGSPLPEYRIRMDEEVVRKLLPDSDQADEYIRTNLGIARIPLPFHKKSYRRYLGLPAGPDNVKFAVGEWQTFALNEISKNHGIKSLTLLGQSYKFGQNLQAFNTVIHLDRDTWNAESMKQRTARAWRQGQDSTVTEITIDTVYEESRNEMDAALDDIRRYFQEMSSDLFDAIIKGAQTLALGEEWTGMTKEQASMMKLDRKMMELAASPYSGRSVPPGMA
jgi:hypothetical protein